MGVKLYFYWRFRFHLYVLPWPQRWQIRRSIERFQELEVLDDKRLQAQQQIELIFSSNLQNHQQESQGTNFQERRSCFSCWWPMVRTHKTKRKFNPKWEGLFVVDQSTQTELIVSQIQMVIRSWCRSMKIPKEVYPWSCSTPHLWSKKYYPKSF